MFVPYTNSHTHMGNLKRKITSDFFFRVQFCGLADGSLPAALTIQYVVGLYNWHVDIKSLGNVIRYVAINKVMP